MTEAGGEWEGAGGGRADRAAVGRRPAARPARSGPGSCSPARYQTPHSGPHSPLQCKLMGQPYEIFNFLFNKKYFLLKKIIKQGKLNFMHYMSTITIQLSFDKK